MQIINKLTGGVTLKGSVALTVPGISLDLKLTLPAFSIIHYAPSNILFLVTFISNASTSPVSPNLRLNLLNSLPSFFILFPTTLQHPLSPSRPKHSFHHDILLFLSLCQLRQIAEEVVRFPLLSLS